MHYYAYRLCDQSVKIDPVPFLKILTDCLDKRPLNICLDRFKKDEEPLYEHNIPSVPILAVWFFMAIYKTFYYQDSI